MKPRNSPILVLLLLLLPSLGFSEEIRVGFENDYFAPFQKDRWLTNRITFSGFGITAGTEMYTPTDKRSPAIPEGDRPWDGYTYVGSVFRLDPKRTIQIRGGALGAASYAAELQEFVHNDLGFGTDPMGWDTQNSSTFAIDSIYEHSERSFFTSLLLDGELHSRYGVRIGNVIDSVFLKMDLTRSLDRWRFFIGLTGEGVLFNTFIDGRAFADNNYSRDDRRFFVAEARAGLGYQFDSYRVEYQYKYLTEEFEAQDGRHLFGSINLIYQWGEDEE